MWWRKQCASVHWNGLKNKRMNYNESEKPRFHGMCLVVRYPKKCCEFFVYSNFFLILYLSVFLLYSDAVFFDAQNPKQLKYCWLSCVILRQYSIIRRNTCLFNSCGQLSYLIEWTFEIYFYSFSFNIFWSYSFFLSLTSTSSPHLHQLSFVFV